MDFDVIVLCDDEQDGLSEVKNETFTLEQLLDPNGFFIQHMLPSTQYRHEHIIIQSGAVDCLAARIRNLIKDKEDLQEDLDKAVAERAALILRLEKISEQLGEDADRAYVILDEAASLPAEDSEDQDIVKNIRSFLRSCAEMAEKRRESINRLLRRISSGAIHKEDNFED